MSTEEQREVNSEMWLGPVTHSLVGRCKQSGFSLSVWEAGDGSKLRKEPEALGLLGGGARGETGQVALQWSWWRGARWAVLVPSEGTFAGLLMDCRGQRWW